MGVGPGPPAIGSASSSDQLLLGLPWKSHMCVFLVGDSLPENRAPGKAGYRAALQGAHQELGEQDRLREPVEDWSEHEVGGSVAHDPPPKSSVNHIQGLSREESRRISPLASMNQRSALLPFCIVHV